MTFLRAFSMCSLSSDFLCVCFDGVTTAVFGDTVGLVKEAVVVLVSHPELETVDDSNSSAGKKRLRRLRSFTSLFNSVNGTSSEFSERLRFDFLLLLLSLSILLLSAAFGSLSFTSLFADNF